MFHQSSILCDRGKKDRETKNRQRQRDKSRNSYTILLCFIMWFAVVEPVFNPPGQRDFRERVDLAQLSRGFGFDEGLAFANLTQKLDNNYFGYLDVVANDTQTEG